jgi:hypothetical protein
LKDKIKNKNQLRKEKKKDPSQLELIRQTPDSDYEIKITKGGARNFSCPGLLNKYINSF